MIRIDGRVEIPRELLDIARSGLLKRKDWQRVFQYVERGAMGSGGILERNLNRPEVQAPLAPSTIERKRRQGLPTTALVGKRGRIQKALSSATTSFRRRKVIMRKRGGVTFRVYFAPNKFPMADKADPFTLVLQRGRMKSMTTKRGSTLSRAESIAKAKARDTGDVASVNRMPGRPVMSYYPGDEAKLTPALLKGVYQVLREKGLAE